MVTTRIWWPLGYGDHSTMATTFPCHGRIHIQHSSDKATTRSTRPTTTHPRPRCTLHVLMHMHTLHCAPHMVDLHISAESVECTWGMHNTWQVWGPQAHESWYTNSSIGVCSVVHWSKWSIARINLALENSFFIAIRFGLISSVLRWWVHKGRNSSVRRLSLSLLLL